MFQGFFGIIQLISIYIPLAPIFIILFFWKKIGENALTKALLLLLCVDFLTDFLTLFLAVWNHWVLDSIYIHQTYYFLFVFTSYNVIRLGFTSPKAKKIIGISFSLVALYLLFILLTDFGLKSTLVNPSSLIKVVIILTSIFYFYQTFDEMKIKSLINHPFFWVVSALFIYQGGSFFLALFQNVIVKIDLNSRDVIWPIYNISTILFNLLILKAVWLMKKAS